MEPQYKLTTTDNPYSPFTQFAEWYALDESMGYHTCSYLARVTYSSSELPQEEEDAIIQETINDIVKMNITGTYRKVKEEDYED